MGAELQQFTKLHEKITGYELTTLLLRNGKQLGLKSSELLVFTTLATYWNGEPVFPRISTLSENTTLSEKAVRTAINGLIQKGYLIKSKRGRNANIYNINVNAVKATIESGKSDRISAVNFTAPCIKSNHEKLNNEQQHNEPEPQKAKSNVVAFSSKSSNRKHRTITLADVPNFIKQNKKVKNPCGYWASLSDEVREELIQKHSEKLEKQRKREENRRKAEEEKRQYYADLYDTSKAVNPRECDSWLSLGRKLGKIKD